MHRGSGPRKMGTRSLICGPCYNSPSLPRRKLRQDPHELLGGYFCEAAGLRRPEVESIKAGFQVEEEEQVILV